MKVYRCLICGDTYLGTEVPTRCPFCGADKQYIPMTEDHPDNLNDVSPTETEVADLKHAIELEYSNARFYFAMAQRDKDSALSSLYKRLAKVEKEHLEVFSKLLKQAEPEDASTPGEKGDSWCDDIKDSYNREHTARDFYITAADRATTPRVKQVFEAVSKVENDHIVLDEHAAKMAGCDSL